MERGWNDTTCSGPERPRLGQQPYDRGRVVPNDRRSCFQCGQEGHISRNCPVDARNYESRYMDRPGGFFSRWPPEHWQPSRPPTSFHKESGNFRADHNRENNGHGRRVPFDDQAEYYFRPRDVGDRTRENESSRGLDTGVSSHSSFRERDSKSSRNGVRKPQDMPHQTTLGHRRDEHKEKEGLKDEGKGGKSQRVDAHLEVKVCSSTNGVVTSEGNVESQRGGQVSKSSAKVSHSELEVVRKDSVPVLEEGARTSTKEVDHQKLSSGSDIHGAVSDKDRNRRCENGGKRVQKLPKEDAGRTSDTSCSRSHPKLPLSVLCSKAIENGPEGISERKASTDFPVLISAPEIELAVPVCSVSGDKKTVKDEASADKQDTNASSASLPQDLKEVEKTKMFETQNSGKGETDSIVDCSKAKQSEKARDVVVEDSVLADAKRSTITGEAQNKPGKGKRTSRWDTPRVLPRAESTADAPPSSEKTQSGDAHKEEKNVASSKEIVPEPLQLADKLHQREVVEDEKLTVSNKDRSTEVVVQNCESKRDSAKEEKVGTSTKDLTVGGSQSDEHKLPLCRGIPEQDNKRRPDCDISHTVSRVPGNDDSDVEKDPLVAQPESGPSSWNKRRHLRERNHERDWVERESGYDGRGRELDSDRLGVGVERCAEKDNMRRQSEHGSLSPMRRRIGSRETDSTHDAHTGYRSREVSVDRSSDRNGYSTYMERLGQKPGSKTLDGGLKPEYRRRFETIDGRYGFGSSLSSECRNGEDGLERRMLGTDLKHSRVQESQPVRSQIRPPYANLIGAPYTLVVNARCELQKSLSPMAISPPPCTAEAVHQHPFLSNEGEETICSTSESLSRGWLYNDRHGDLQGPVELGQLRELLDNGLLQSDHLVRREGTNEWVTLEHAGSPPSNWLPSSPRNKQPSSLSSSGLSQASPLSCPPHSQDRLKDELVAVEYADHDICPPGTEVSNAASSLGGDFEDLHIDERVEKLMQGFTYVPGKEGEIVYEALSSAASRVREALGYETDNLNEESPRSHGGFANLGDQWKDGDFGSDVQGLEASGNDQHVSKADDKLEEKGMATVPDAAVEVVSVPKPPPPVLCRRNRLVEKKPELWTWPARGGDWKLYAYQVENPQPVVGEKAQVHSLVQKKVVLNGGHPFCDGKVRDPRDQRKRDPRKRELQNPAEESAKLNGVDWSKLEVPKFALKLGNTTDDPNVTQSQHLMTTPKGGHAATTSVQGSTPSAHLTQGRLSLGGPGTGSKAAKVSSTLALVPATGTKSGGPVIHPQAVSNSARIVHQSSKHELLIVKKNSIFNKHRSLPRAAGVGDGRLKPTSERILQQTGRPEAAVRDRPSEHQQGFDGEPSKVVPKKVFSRRDLPSRDTLKLHDGPWFYLDGMGREMGPFSHAEIQSLVSNQKLFEGSSVYRKDDDLWVPVSVPSIERPISSPADSGIPSESGQKCRLASLTKPPAAKHTSESSTIQTSLNDGSRYSPSEPLPPAVSVSENSDPKSRESCAPTNNVSKAVSFHDIHPQFLGFTRGKLHEYVMKSFKSASLPAALYEGLEKWFQAKEKEKISIAPLPALHGSPASSVPTPAAVKCRANDDAGGSSPRYERQSQNQSALTGRRSAHGTPSSSYDDVAKTVETEAWSRATSVGQNGKTGEELSPSKRKAWALEDSKQNRRSSQKRRLLDSEESDGDEKGGHSTRAIVGDLPHLIDDNPFRSPDMVPQDLVSGGQEKGWATLKFGTLRMIFRHLRGDVKALTNASAACKSWMAAGKVCKTELKSVDLSSVRGQRLDALMEALPGFRAPKLKRLILKGCTNVKPESLAEVLRACPSISAVEIDSLVPFKELTHMFPKVRWVTEQFGVQSPRDHISRKRDEIHFKTKSLRVIGESKAGYLRDSVNRESDDFEMHLVSDSASKVRSPSGFACNVNTDLEATTNDSLQDSETTHSARTPNGAKHFKLNNGSKKFDSSNGYAKTSKRENGDSMSHLPHVKRKTLTTSSHRKHEQAIYRRGKPLSGSQRGISDKGSASSVKGEFPSKGYGMLSMLEGEKSLEKEIGLLLREMMEADTSRVFQPASIATEVKGDSSKSGKTIDLWMMEKKHRNGAYSSGKNGFDAFRDDVKLLIRNGFRNPHDNPVLQATKRIFKVTHSYFEAKDNQSAGRSSVEIQMQSKSFGARPFGKVEKGRSKAPTMSQHRPGKKRKVWEDDGVQKGKIGSAKKGRQGDWSDVDSDSDSERETRRFSKSKKERSWDSDEGDSSEDEEDGFMEGDEEETETEPSDSDIPSESEGEDGDFEADNYDTDDDMEFGYLDWGARMTKAAMVPPVTRKYVVIEEYRIVADEDRVLKKMQVELPKDFASLTALEKAGDHYSHLDIPEIKEYQPRKRLGEEVMEQEVYGIDPYTHNLLLDTMPVETTYFTEAQRQQFIEERLLLVLNKEGSKYTGTGKAPMEYPLERVVQRIASEAEICKDWALYDFADQLLVNMKARQRDKFVAYRKGLGVVCNKAQGLEKDEFVVEFFGEVYPPWRWYEKQDGIRSLQKKDKDPTPEFYNIYYERPKGDAAGYDLLVVDAMHKANFASRLCHSCRPNCEAKITAVNDTYIIGVYSLKPIKRGEELTFDYNSVTESKEEYNNAVCLCGSQGCRGSYLNLTGSGTFEEVIARDHGLLDRHRLLLNACSPAPITNEEIEEMRQAGLGSCVLSGLPTWAVKYAARLVHFMNFEKTHLPAELLKDFDLKRKQGVVEGSSEVDAEITTEGVYNQRLQNLTITLDKVRHILTELFDKPGLAPPPVRKLDLKEMVQWIWKKENSVVNELLQCLAPHLEREKMLQFKESVGRNSPNDSGNNLHLSLLWLRDALRRLPATCKARHDAAADLIHMYANTKHFFVLEDYAVVKSTPVLITPLDLGTKHSLTGNRRWSKVYSKEYVWGQLINWFKQKAADPGASLAKSSRGCLVLPDVSSCYARSIQHDFRLAYGPKHREKMIFYMEHKPEQKWPKSKIWSKFWSFKNERGLFGSPMLDSVLEGRPLRDEMMRWLKIREDTFVGPWDEQ
ncbi:[histone H3]-lysine4 N-trimethyltransferase ATXR3 [Marchantia polymorpha subsp. ruderalis]|uniref:CCHC-type domain-containing protein n=2 Tax=Marchantia polymorpha TaxID=3197 RepID=A0A176WDR7_MARPO|nr:hypothetical protein AXG93_3522s1130 [Marchantia polymorpha subsp. ruderalis]PTQ44250.1 hypothetical protein MARPO_0021s0105 [Marchantia polymorpha]PTQ44252.1 hypothetical protein MARPO_0021s0105 [Marchantia polymorpha]BBN01324.1 hypothetical protein Mp_2g06500 [Marchantia polymorpha subsp. ruderalis]BBN01325.1 hypothetical protein Mp_2g06500 [Marchantia polymorpha subsp. ruderalis]|eukprot:PTQ44250.1 hypothetical protein MARPO_0021s0105 [Marchantia polymorpha]